VEQYEINLIFLCHFHTFITGNYNYLEVLTSRFLAQKGFRVNIPIVWDSEISLLFHSTRKASFS
jgi:hypothetical protein